VLLGQGVELPPHVWPLVSGGLAWISPLVIAVVAALIVSVAWRDRHAWQRFWTLRGSEPTPPTVLASLGLGVTAALYLLQATGLNASSVRYLVPAWVVLPGLIASALRALPSPSRQLGAACLLVPWSIAQANVMADLNRPSPTRALVRELERRGADGVVAQTPVALIVANLSQGRVGTLEYLPSWPRLRDRYAGRFRSGGPVTCVVDLDFPWPVPEGVTGAPRQDLGRDLQALALRNPGRVRRVERIGRFEIWDVDLPLSSIIPDDPSLLLSGPGSAKVAKVSQTRP
jgi:hypothetical protein